MEAPGPEARRRSAKRNDLGVPRRIAIDLSAVSARADDVTLRVDDDGADRDFLRLRSEDGLTESEPHEMFVVERVGHDER